MKMQIEIDMDNADFQDFGQNKTVIACLESLIAKVSNGEISDIGDKVFVRDFNGNKVLNAELIA